MNASDITRIRPPASPQEIDCLAQLYRNHFSEEATFIEELRAHASERRMFRLTGRSHRAIGVKNDDTRENNAFIRFGEHFKKFGLNVPAVYCWSEDLLYYLEEDLGDTSLFDLLDQTRTATNPFPEEIHRLYVNALETLPRFQIEAGRSIDFSITHTHQAFDETAMMNDMLSFKKNYLDRIAISVDETNICADFKAFCRFLGRARCDFFMYRDFQSRNIMVQGGQLFFIDFQGGRRGPLQYDVVSLLQQSKAAIPSETRKTLLNCYLKGLKNYISFNEDEFFVHYYGFGFLRLMQVLGVYGRKGLLEGMPYFRDSIPYAISNLKELLTEDMLPGELTYLQEVFYQVVNSQTLQQTSAR